MSMLRNPNIPEKVLENAVKRRGKIHKSATQRVAMRNVPIDSMLQGEVVDLATQVEAYSGNFLPLGRM